MERMKIRINKMGEVRLEVEGCLGPACKDISRRIEEALGTTLESTPTGEMDEYPVPQDLNQPQGAN